MPAKDYNPGLYNVVVMRPGNRLRDLRKAAGLTQTALAEKTGVSQPAISQLENGTLQMDLAWMRAFARVLKCAPVDLLDDADNPYRLDEREQQLVGNYRKADELQREMVDRVAAPAEPYRADREDEAA